jgi:hypothetical protein
VHFKQADGRLDVVRDSDKYSALHGLTRALAANAVQGVSTGFTRELDIVGIGYRADVKGRWPLHAGLFASHRVLLPDGVDLKIDKQTHLVLSGLRQAVGGPGGGQHSRAAQAGSLQEQGRPLYRRAVAQEGRQDRGECEMIRNSKRMKSASHSRAHPAQGARHRRAAALAVFRSVPTSTCR